LPDPVIGALIFKTR